MRARSLIPLVLALVAGKLALDHFSDVDLWWHLRLGLDMLERGALPTSVEYSWTGAGLPYLANDWLAEILFALAFTSGGFVVVALLKALAAALLALLLYAAASLRAEGNARAAGLAVAAALFVAASNFIARPVLLGHLCLALELVLLELVWRGRRWAALGLPVAFALWINLHGSWPVGFGPLLAAALAALCFERRPLAWRRLVPRATPPAPGARGALLLGAGLSALALLLNPIGPRLLLRPFEMLLARPDLGAIKEWSPVPLSDPSSWFLLGVAALLVAAAALGRKGLPLFDLALLLLAFGLALSSALYHLPFAVLAAPLLAEQLAGRVAPTGLAHRRLNLAVAALALALLGAIGLARLRSLEEDLAAEAPLDAVLALEESGLARARGFNYFDFGGLLVFRGIPTYVDGRLEPFLHAGIFARYLSLEDRGDIAALERDGVRWILARTGTRIAAAAEDRPRWRALHRDDLAEVWVRDPVQAETLGDPRAP